LRLALYAGFSDASLAQKQGEATQRVFARLFRSQRADCRPRGPPVRNDCYPYYVSRATGALS